MDWNDVAVAAGRVNDVAPWDIIVVDKTEEIPPRTQLDAVGLDEGRLALAGLGWLQPVEGSQPMTRRDTTCQWMQSNFGASFLIKRRESPRVLPDGNRPQCRTRPIDATCASRKNGDASMSGAFAVCRDWRKYGQPSWWTAQWISSRCF